MVGPSGKGFTVPHNPVLDTDMRKLVARLLGLAREHGAEVIGRVRDIQVELHGGRPRSVSFSHGPCPDARYRIEAPLFVDASGRQGVVRHQVPDLDRDCPDVTALGLCSASQYAHDVADRGGALSFLETHDAQPGDTVTFVGFAGGFSALGISVSSDLGSVHVLTGTLASRQWGTGPSLMTLTRAQHPWIGASRFGGAGLIPLRRPYARLTAPGVALVGDSGCQMFPAHGSGVGIGLVGGAQLAEATAHVDDPGAEAALWGYQVAFQREHGGTLAAYDIVRRLSSRLGTSGVDEMFRAGLVGPASTLAGLQQVWWNPSPSELPRLAAGLAKRPALAAQVLPSLARSTLAHRVYGTYPEQLDIEGLRQWSRRADHLLGRSAI